jgi:hypothetical protein
MTPTDEPLELKLLQFPVRLTFLIIINKLQGQLKQDLLIHLVYGRNFENACFSHGQLCVACSRVRKPSDLFVYTLQKEKQKILYNPNKL